MADQTKVPRAPWAGLFRFDIDSVDVGTFHEVSGLGLEMKIEEIVEGGQNGFVYKMPGLVSWPNIVLRRGLTDNGALFEWIKEVASQAGGGSKVTRRNGSITALDERRQTLQQWSFAGAIPVRWQGPEFSTTAQAWMVEEIEIAHHGFT